MTREPSGCAGLWPGSKNLSGRALNGGFTVALAILIIILLASWIPHYLTWPWCRDEDTFATLAQSWDAGIRPYRDIRAYNFPGHIYLHWLLGKVLGWGHTAPFYAVDASAVLGLGVALVFWSRRRLGGWLPGLLSFVAFLQFYLSREYEQVAERDWHATLAAVLAIMTLEAWPQRPAVWLAAALEAAAVTIRPHAIFFLPAIASALMERRRPRRGLAEWGLAFTAFVALAFAPLVIDGLLDDLIRGLRVAAYGGPYSKASLTVAREALELELRDPWTIFLAASLIVVWAFHRLVGRPMARTWLLALAAAILYRTVHPVQHAYLMHPLALVSAMVLALPVASLLSLSWIAQPVRALLILLLFLKAFPGRPLNCDPGDSLRAIVSIACGQDPEAPPSGCRYFWFRPKACNYEWRDYCRTLAYLRHTTSPATEIANVLRLQPFPSLNGPVGRLSPFRAESGICWMWLIDIDLDGPFAEALENTPDSVVVWSPDEGDRQPRLRLERVSAVIRRCYRFDARFGAIEVWRRSAADEAARTPMPGSPAASGSSPPAIAVPPRR